MRKPSARFTAVLLLFLFLQKAGMRLWMHEHFHQGSAISLSMLREAGTDGSRRPEPGKNNTERYFLQMGCDCVDVFFLPLTYTETVAVESPITPITDQPATD